MVTCKCKRCGGTGRLDQYKGVVGGVCFKCGGKGSYQSKSKPKESKLYPITAVRISDNERISVFNVRAYSESEAVKKAKATLSKGKGYIADTAEIGGEL